MRILTVIIVLIFTIHPQVWGQPSEFLSGVPPGFYMSRHIEEIKIKREDSTYIESLIPQATSDFHFRGDATQHFPYPIIFIHGLIGSSDSWIDFYEYALTRGWSYGGQIRFNLNADNNLSYSNIVNVTLSDIADFNTSLPAADFYIINFNCAIDGTPYGGNYNTTTQSNQAAIFKQGIAIRQAIKYVLAATGKDKVILFGHSMGGLAARQYLQNQNNWQSDNKHHIAKLITSGTPHGGSNTTFPGGSVFAGVDEGSDAVRDLRTSYFYSGNPGVYLFGGTENSSVMFDRLDGFYNYDVNCNGATGNNVVGLNQKPMSTDLDMTCVVGNLNQLGSDLIVGTTQAQIKSYYVNTLSETFTVNALHTALPGYLKSDFEAFDEPDFYELSYGINSNTTYSGYITLQAPDADFNIDYDDFVFRTYQPGWVNVKVDNIAGSSFPFGVSILSHPSLDYQLDQIFQTDNIQTQTIYLPPGTYYLEFYAMGSSTSWQYPYHFQLSWSTSNSTDIKDVGSNSNIRIYPNPTSSQVEVRLSDYKGQQAVVSVCTETGEIIFTRAVEHLGESEYINLEPYPDGIYFISVTTPEETFKSKVLKHSH
jgi:pimeloyl-ACP methyl ester carboxylesterase